VRFVSRLKLKMSKLPVSLADLMKSTSPRTSDATAGPSPSSSLAAKIAAESRERKEREDRKAVEDEKHKKKPSFTPKLDDHYNVGGALAGLGADIIKAASPQNNSLKK